MRKILKFQCFAAFLIAAALLVVIYKKNYTKISNEEIFSQHLNSERSKIVTKSVDEKKTTNVLKATNNNNASINSANLLESLVQNRTVGTGTRFRLIDGLGGVSFEVIEKYSLNGVDIKCISDATAKFIDKSSVLYAKHLSKSLVADTGKNDGVTYYLKADANLLSDSYKEFEHTMIEHFGNTVGKEISITFPAELYFGGMGNRDVRISVSNINGDIFYANVVEFDPANNRPIRSSQLFYEQFNRIYPNIFDKNGKIKHADHAE